MKTTRVVWGLVAVGLGCAEIQEVRVTSARELAVFDADGDGDSDILFVAFNEGGELLLHVSAQEAPGVFGEAAPVLGSLGQEILASEFTVADLDADGDDDLLGCIRQNEGDLFFAARQEGGLLVQSIDLAFSCQSTLFVNDFSQDGLPDLTLLDGGAVHLLAQQGDLSFAEVQSIPEVDRLHAVLDANGDGAPELLGSRSDQLLLLRNDGAGVLVSEPLDSPLADAEFLNVLANDLDGDGADELFFFGIDAEAKSRRGSFLLRNDGAGVFTAEPLEPDGEPLLPGVLGDLDGDGTPELISQGHRVSLASPSTEQEHLRVFRLEDGDFVPDGRIRTGARNILDLLVRDLDGDGASEVALFQVLDAEVALGDRLLIIGR